MSIESTEGLSWHLKWIFSWGNADPGVGLLLPTKEEFKGKWG